MKAWVLHGINDLRFEDVEMPHLEPGIYKGILTSPLATAEFEPDAIIINCRNAELRTILFAIKTQTGTTMKTEFDAIDSCSYT